MKCETIIVSDIHLGNKMSRAKELLELLKTLDFAQLILLGDIFQDLNFNRLNSAHWKFLTYIRKVAKEKKIIWVKGNHDLDVEHVVSNMLGINVLDEYIWETNGKRICAMHGHQFDGIAKRWKWTSKLGGSIMVGIQYAFGDGEIAKKAYKKIDSLERTLSNAPSKIKEGAIKYCIHNDFDTIICGHTHNAEHEMNIEGIEYVNTGHWLSHRCSYVCVDENGEITLKFHDISTIEQNKKSDIFIVE